MILAATILAFAVQGTPAPATADDAVHQELRVLRDTLVNAIVSQDVEVLVKHITKDVSVTWQNTEHCRGEKQLRDFFERMQKGNSKAFKGYKVVPTPDDKTILYGGDTGISYGTSVGLFSVAGGEYELKNRWTATVVKEEGRWKLASYHVSMNVLDNPILNTAKSSLLWVGVVTLVLAGGVGLLVGRVMGKKARAA
jgi:ketosteroid isomerase-like protein